MTACVLAERGDGASATESTRAPLGIDVGEGGDSRPATDLRRAPLSPTRVS